ncbi:MAG: substrate-binding domain-containing protein, partial [Candidatus Thiodiazotropha sp. (ex Lucinoma kastoroae)]|nr:substrate-binding domain-containing protein [Candidatus Thiodiazotropha sp. (ex Lucinoma kastoroae)]
VMVAKLEGIQWFDDMRRGISDFSRETGVNAYQIGHHTGDPLEQIKLVERLIKKKVDAILVVPNDPGSMDPILKKANDAGILTFSHEAPSLQNVSYDIEALNNADFGREMMRDLAKNMQYEGDYIVIVGLLTMDTHMVWAEAAVAYQKAHYPEMNLITYPYLEDDNNRNHAYRQIVNVLEVFPNIKGILGCTAGSAPAAGLVIEEQGLLGKVFKSGLSLPSMAKAYLQSGAVQSISFWSPADVGYVTAMVALKALRGEPIQSGINLGRRGYENIELEGKVIYGNASIFATRDNVHEYDF